MEVCRLVKSVNIGPALQSLGRLEFVSVGDGTVNKPFCSVVLQDKFTPELHELMDGLGLPGTLARVILRRLEPGQNIPPHVDDWMPQEAAWRRYQLPLLTNPDITMRWPEDGVSVHLAA